MIIGLHDAEKEHMKNKRFPNYALMKISAFYKARGDIVEWWDAINSEKYDYIFSSKVFDFTPENPYLPERTIKGGTGYNVHSKLPIDIDNVEPDYSIYPDYDSAIGYITRGCPRMCEWCSVKEKEGDIAPYRRWNELVRQDSDKLVLLDNNILACDYGMSQLSELIGSGYKIDLNQGMDSRFVDDNIAKIISQLKWIRFIRFSCDTISQVEAIRKTVLLLEKYGVKPYRLFIYLLVTKDLDDAAFRVEALKKFKGINIYAQAERNNSKGIIPNKAQLEFAQRYVYGHCYRNESWYKYCVRNNYDFHERRK